MTYGHGRSAPAEWRQLDAERRFALVQQVLAATALHNRPR